MKYTQTNLPDSQIKISFVVEANDLKKYEDKAWEKIISNTEIDGFRKGKAPKDLVLKRVGEMAVLEYIAEDAISDAYKEYLTKENTDTIGRPFVSITKMGIGSDLEFDLTTAIMPEIKLADYKKIAKDTKLESVEEAKEEDVDSLIKELRTARAREDNRIANKDNPENFKTDFEDSELPEFTDEFVKTLGDFENVADFRTKMLSRMSEDKVRTAKDKRRIKIVESVTDGSQVEVPKVLTDYELDKMLAKLEQDLMYSGMKIDEYLSHIKKSKEEIREEWSGDAKKRAKSILVLDKIAKEENIVVENEVIDREVEILKNMYKDVDPIRAREYIVEIMTQSKVLEFLENIS